MDIHEPNVLPDYIFYNYFCHPAQGSPAPSVHGIHSDGIRSELVQLVERVELKQLV
jgi:hypothetical protein